ncbi:hypothetical protein DFH28DRAFT_899186 [Melampsora americana]|nr:hypothetical protein DFH28DRAFT_910269 [Melampsora americana]KAH9812336.1 hypothetical protein DFH28DRAFT_899186 [Melampsora americana]
MTNQRKIKPRPLENLNRRPQNPLDARILAMKRCAREHAENTVGNDVLAAADSYERRLRNHPNAPGVEMLVPPENVADNAVVNGEQGPDETLLQQFLPHSPVSNHDNWRPDPSEDNEVVHFANSLNVGFYAGRRQTEESNWRSRFPAMFPVFLSCQQLTGNWSHVAHDIDWKEPCNCPGSYRTVDVLDLILRLIQAGFIGGTPVNPETVITIRLLRFFHTIWKYCSLRFKPFAEGLNDFLDAGNPLFLNRDRTAVSTYCFSLIIFNGS